DRNLAEFFFDGIADRVRKGGNNRQIPTVLFAGAHDFVFRPTRTSYDRELQIWESARSSGHKDLYKKLTTKYAGGYFYKAAREILDSGDLAPARPAPIIE